MCGEGEEKVTSDSASTVELSVHEKNREERERERSKCVPPSAREDSSIKIKTTTSAERQRQQQQKQQEKQNEPAPIRRQKRQSGTDGGAWHDYYGRPRWSARRIENKVNNNKQQQYQSRKCQCASEISK